MSPPGEARLRGAGRQSGGAPAGDRAAPGGQAQFIERPLAPRAGGRLSQLIAELQEEPQASPSLQQLAARAAMSERTFIRRFRETTGVAPGAWLVAAKVDRARDLLETTDLSVEQVAAESGFGAATTLRHHFRQRLGLSPAAYRDRFGASGFPQPGAGSGL